MIGSVIFCVLGFYRRRYSGSDPTVAAENGETTNQKMQVAENRGEESSVFL
jgi:hypothetical protein